MLEDVTFVNNSIIGVITNSSSNGDSSPSSAVVGGGGLWVAGGGNQTVLSLENCSFIGNDVTIIDHSGNAHPLGGGVCAALGLSTSPFRNSSLLNVTLTSTRVVATRNRLLCPQCTPGRC